MGGQLVVAGEHRPDRFVEVDMVNNETPASSPGGEVVVYEASDGEVRVDVRLEQETVWLTQQQMGICSGGIVRSLPSISTMHSGRVSWPGKQPVQNLHRFKPGVSELSSARSTTTTLT